MTARSVWVDVAKGAAITLVVFGHAWRGLQKKGLIPDDLYHLVDDAIYFFHMPMFFMIAGFFFFSRISHGLLSAHARDATKRLLIPLVLWTYIFLFLRWIFADFTNAQPDITSLFVLPIPGVLHFWFLWALWVIQIGLLLLAAVFPERLRPRYLIPTALILTLGLWWFMSALPLKGYLAAAYGHAFFFVTGAVLYRWINPAQISAGATLAAALGFAGLLILTRTAGLTPISNALLTLGLCLSFLTGIKGLCDHAPPGLAILQWVGAFSFSIYMMHTIFSAGIRELLLAQGITSLGAHLWTGVIAGIACPIAFALIARHYKLGRLLGITTRLPRPSAT